MSCDFSGLPTLVLVKIFRNYLNIEDRLKMRLVSKQCYSISNFCQSSLAISSLDRSLVIHSGPFGYKKFAFTYDHLPYNCSIELAAERSLKFQFFRFNFSRIQKLYLDSCHSYSSQKKFIVEDVQRFLSYFRELKQLEMHSLKLAQTVIDLPLLKVLTLKGCLIYELAISAPALDAFICWNYFGEIRFSHAESLRYMQCDEYYPDIQSFKNLECLDCKFIKPIDKSLLQRLPRLRKLNLYSYLIQPFALKELIDERKRLRREHELRISFLGFQECLVTQPFFYEDDINSYYLNRNNIKLVRDHYDRIGSVPWTTKCDYSSLKTEFNGQIPANFHSKFLNINEVECRVDGAKFGDADYRALIEFLTKCNSIQFLSVSNCSGGSPDAVTGPNGFGQSVFGHNAFAPVRRPKPISQRAFFEQMYLLPSILYLRIETDEWTDYDWAFLDGMRNLMYVKLEFGDLSNFSISHLQYGQLTLIKSLIGFIFNAFRRCRYFKEFYFSSRRWPSGCRVSGSPLVVTVRFLDQFYLAVGDQKFSYSSLEETVISLQNLLVIASLSNQ